jgi:hypothetical protein
MGNMPKVSVVIPIYNASAYMDKCIESILAQDFEDFEIILVNDGSMDDSFEKAENWAEKYQGKISAFTQENAGQGDARNKGVLYAKGEYIMFVDSDDTVDETFIVTAYRTIVENDADMAVFDAYIVDEDGKTTGEMLGCHSYDTVITLETYPRILFEYPAPWNKIYRKDLFTRHNLKYPTNMWYEDLVGASEFYSKAKKIAICHKKLYYYMQRSNSVMHSAQTDKNLEIIKAVDMIMDYYRTENLDDKYRNELEYLAIYHILVATAGRTVRADAKSPYPPKLVAYMNEMFPKWRSNRYVKELSNANKVKLWLLYKEKYRILHRIYSIFV